MAKKKTETMDCVIIDNTEPIDAVTGVYVVNAALVAIRVAPNINATAAETIPKGTKVRAHASSSVPDPWLVVTAIEDQSVNGFINGNYLVQE